VANETGDGLGYETDGGEIRSTTYTTRVKRIRLRGRRQHDILHGSSMTRLLRNGFDENAFISLSVREPSALEGHGFRDTNDIEAERD